MSECRETTCIFRFNFNRRYGRNPNPRDDCSANCPFQAGKPIQTWRKRIH